MSGCPKDIVIPFILIPGIMGTRLQNSNGQVIWDPDDIWKSLGMGLFWGPKRRKKEFIGGATHTPGYLTPVTVPKEDMGVSIYDQHYGSREERGWGEPAASFYKDMLQHLDDLANTIGPAVRQQNPLNILTETPAFAIGYAWSDSNADSGAIAAQRIGDIVSQCKARAVAIGAECPGAVLVTHSMGGFVARAATLLSGAQNDVVSVFSNVMPTDGSPTTIRRTHFGNDRPGGGFFGDPQNYITYLVLGSHGDDVTCLFGHMPGAQQLFPNKRYRTNDTDVDLNGEAVTPGDEKWLKIKNPDGSIALELPQEGDPYNEIYRQEGMIYCGVNPDWLYPERNDIRDGFALYIQQNLIAEEFHDDIIAAGDLHPLTFLSHGDSEDFPSWDRIVWRADIDDRTTGSPRLTTEDIHETHNGVSYEYKDAFFGGNKRKEREINGRKIEFRIEDKAATGDGTVPASAAHWSSLGDVLPDDNAQPSTIGVLHDGYEHAASTSERRVKEWVSEKAVYLTANLMV